MADAIAPTDISHNLVNEFCGPGAATTQSTAITESILEQSGGDRGENRCGSRGPLETNDPPPGALTNASPSRTSQIDQALAQYISLLIADCGAQGSAPDPRLAWRAYASAW